MKKLLSVLLLTLAVFTSAKSFAQGNDCASADPFCTGTTYTFPNNSTGTGAGTGPQAQSGPNYGCLLTTPNPVWYYMEILDPGNIQITISQTNSSGTGTDVDFICWGPFASQTGNCGNLTASNRVDCSYLTATTEVCNITGALTGQYYLLMLTNYANTPGTISFSQTGGSGSTNCAVLCSTPNISTAGTQTLTCSTTSVTLSGSSTTPGVTYQWSGPGGFSSNIANPTVSTAGTYSLTVTNPSNPACPATATQTVTTDNTPPNASTAAAVNLTCTTTTVNLSASSSTGGATYSWGGPGGFSSTSASPSATAAGTYTVTVTNPANGCTATATQTVGTNTTPPNASAGSPEELTCAVTSVNIISASTTPGATYNWSGPGGFASTSAAASVSAAGTYTVTVTDPANGCTASAQQVVTANLTSPDAAAGTSPDLTCSVTSVNISGSSATAGATYSWSGPGGFASSSATDAVGTAGTYTLTVTDPANGCTATAQQIVGSNTTPPDVTADTAQTLSCGVTSVTLGASSTIAGATYSWSGPGGFTSSSQNPTAGTAGTYTVTVTDPVNGCTATAQQVVNIVAGGPVATTGAAQVLTCAVTSVNLSGSASTVDAAYSWSGPGGYTSSAQNPSATAAGTYTLTVTDTTNGCSATATQTVSSNTTAPDAAAGAAQDLTCSVTTLNLSGSSAVAGATYSWSGPGGFTSALQNPAVTAAGTYTVTVTDTVNGCTATAQQTINTNTTPPNAATGTTLALTCVSPSANLSATSTVSGATFSWSGPGGFTSSSATPTTSVVGTYTVTVTDPVNGCTATATQIVTPSAGAPNISTGATQSLTCTVTALNLSGSSTTAGVTYSWTGPGGFTSASTSPSVSITGTYTLTVTDPSNGCTSVSTQTVNSNTTLPVANAGLNQNIPCGENSVSLNGTGSASGANYSWTTADGTIASGGSTQTPVVSGAGTYVLTVTSLANGCTATDVVTVNALITPVASFTPSPNSGMAPLPVNMINNSTNAVSYVWSLGDGTGSVMTDPSTIYNTPGIYTVTLVATSADGCSDTVTSDVHVEELSVLVIPNIFTPNGDGHNELFQPVVAEGLTEFRATVYDRWGLKMHEWTDEYGGWNGKSKSGADAPDGTYYYIIIAKGADGKEYDYEGYVSLLRK